MTQTIIQAAKKESRKTKTGFSIHDAMNFNLNDEDQEITDPPVTNVDILEEEETDEGEMDKLLRLTDYIDVSEQGTISNASRLDRVLKDRERSKYKKNKKSNMELIDLLTRDDISYLFDPSISSIERESLFLKFEIPASARNQITGALTALTVLMENNQITDNIITGETFKNPILNVLDDIVINIDDIDNSIYNRRGINSHNDVTSTPGNIKSHLISSSITSEAAGLKLSEHIRHLVQYLVYMALYPALGIWAAAHFHNYPLNTLIESKATEIYADVIKWICTFAESPKYKQDSVNSPNTSDDEQQSNDRSDEFGLSNHKRQKGLSYFKSIQTTDDSEYGARSQHGNNRHRHSDSSSDSEDDDDSDDGSELISIYPIRPKKIESTTETRINGEHADLGDILSVPYTSEYYLGFSSRALMLLNSLLRHGIYHSNNIFGIH